MHDRAILGGYVVEREVKPVAIRFGIEQQRQPVLGPEPTFRLDQCPALADIDFRIEVDRLRVLTRHAGCKHEIFDCKLVDADVEIGQQRCVRIAGKQFGQTFEPASARRQLTHVYPTPKKGERSPVELDLRDGEEHALGVAHDHVAQHRGAIDVALDPTDLETQSGSGRDLGDLVGDETLPDRRTQERGHRYQREEYDGEQPSEALGPATLALALGSLGLLDLDEAILRHQNACPRLT